MKSNLDEYDIPGPLTACQVRDFVREFEKRLLRNYARVLESGVMGPMKDGQTEAIRIASLLTATEFVSSDTPESERYRTLQRLVLGSPSPPPA